MEISKIYSGLKIQTPQKKEEVKTKKAITASRVLNNYPKGFRPFFGARLFRTPENFYEQEFNKNGMPKTMADYLNKNYAVNSKKPPAQLSKEAFEDLQYCESIEDVKEMFPDEPLFADIKTLETIRPTGGYLYQMRAYGLGNKEVLQSGDDLTVYLLKKIFLESKDLDEINADFDKDRKEGLERDEGYCNEGAYFLPSTLKSIGVKLPDKSYWKSLQANRTDKEYTPYTFILTKPRKKPEFTKPRIKKPINLSPEERQRRREVMLNRWLDMTPEQRAAQLAKMKEGQEGSLLFQYSSPIMLIATEKAHFQDKMFAFFRENKEKLKTDAPEDMENMTLKQRKGMQLFWEYNPRAKKNFSYHVRATFAEFERAKEAGGDALNALLEKAEKIRENNLEKVLRRKLTNPEVIKEELKEIMQNQIFPFPDVYGDKYVRFAMNHEKFKNNIIHLHVKTKLAKSEEEKEKYINSSIEIMSIIFKDFNKQNKKDGISATAALAVVMMPFLEAIAQKAANQGLKNVANKALDDSDEMLTGNPTCILATVEKYQDVGSKDVIEKFKNAINTSMKDFTSGFSDEEIKAEAKSIMNYMSSIVNKYGNYKMLNNLEIRNRCKTKLPGILKDLERNKDDRHDFTEFLKDYEGLLKFRKKIIGGYMKSALDKKDSHFLEKTLRYSCIRDYLYESIIDDYLVKKENKK